MYLLFMLFVLRCISPVDWVIFFLSIGNQAGKGGELSLNETNIIAGALELTEKTARDAMTPISEIFSLDINAKLDRYEVCLYKYTEIIVISFIAIA